MKSLDPEAGDDNDPFLNQHYAKAINEIGQLTTSQLRGARRSQVLCLMILEETEGEPVVL